MISFVLGKHFDSSVESDDNNFRINGYILIRTDHPLNIKRGVVCIRYKESLVNININVRGCIDLQVRSSYFQHFLLGFERLLINIEGFKPNLTVVLGEFNARSRSWWASNISKPEDMQLDPLSLDALT